MGKVTLGQGESKKREREKRQKREREEMIENKGKRYLYSLKVGMGSRGWEAGQGLALRVQVDAGG